jgi:hypothetical protein
VRARSAGGRVMVVCHGGDDDFSNDVPGFAMRMPGRAVRAGGNGDGLRGGRCGRSVRELPPAALPALLSVTTCGCAVRACAGAVRECAGAVQAYERAGRECGSAAPLCAGPDLACYLARLAVRTVGPTVPEGGPVGHAPVRPCESPVRRCAAPDRPDISTDLKDITMVRLSVIGGRPAITDRQASVAPQSPAVSASGSYLQGPP